MPHVFSDDSNTVTTDVTTRFFFVVLHPIIVELFLFLRCNILTLKCLEQATVQPTTFESDIENG